MLDAQDVVGESCGSQFDSDASIMMPLRPDLPVGNVSSSSHSTERWRHMPQTHMQRDEHKPERRVTGDWRERAKTTQSASALVLARKRKRDEQRRKNGDKRQCTDSDASEQNESEKDNMDMEQQLTAFVEYNATDMDSLDINPSQDFDGGCPAEEEASQYMQTCSWEDVTDVNQVHEEASEVFDNVIYAPPPTQVPAVDRATVYTRPPRRSGLGIVPPARKKAASPPFDDSEDSLSDGFEVELNLNGTAKAAAERHKNHHSRGINTAPSPPKTPLKPQWRQRRSVKRDCSFIDGNCSSPTRRLLLRAAPESTRTVSSHELPSSRVIELKDGCFDLTDDVVEEVPRSQPCSTPTSVPATEDTMTVVCSAPATGTGSVALGMGFQPRLFRKRRKVGQQLKLDSFFRPKQR